MEVINLSLDYFQNYVWMMAITSFLALILGLIALVLLNKYKKHKVAGSILLVLGILGTILTIPFGLLSGPLFIIASIMCFVRKSKTSSEIETRSTGEEIS